jgi:hypothetical protein
MSFFPGVSAGSRELAPAGSVVDEPDAALVGPATAMENILRSATERLYLCSTISTASFHGGQDSPMVLACATSCLATGLDNTTN